MKWSNKKGIQHLVTICALKGIRHVVISPGSRNAPLTISFNRFPGIETLVIPDERVAGFTALGIAHRTSQAVALVCTSGSAMLNYSPALAEAFYSHVPLLVLSADRPDYWIDQREGQAINQKEAYGKFVKGSFCLPLEPDNEKTLWFHDRMINEAINLSMKGNKGPVHINVPLEEPLYDLVQMEDVHPKIIQEIEAITNISKVTLEQLNEEINSFHKIMILFGQSEKQETLSDVLNDLCDAQKMVVLSECTSNVLGENVVGCIDRNIITIDDETWMAFQPDLLITMGDSIVSKKIKQKLRLQGINAHWHVSENDQPIDTFGRLSKNILCKPIDFLNKIEWIENDFSDLWSAHNSIIRDAHNQVIGDMPFSDLTVFNEILNQLPEESQLHLANSSPVRYAQLFDDRSDLQYFSNRGVSGIDGSTSAAIGAAIVSEEMVTIVSGDMSFFYDSNAFWHTQVPSNFRCIVINNGGGGIFRIIEGPDSVNELEEFFEVHQENSVKKMAEAYGIAYLKAKDGDSLIENLNKMYNETDEPCILEVKTPREINSTILKEYFEKIKSIKNEF